MRQKRRDLDTHEAVRPIGVVIDAAQHIRSHTYIFNAQSFVQLIRGEPRFGRENTADALVIFVPAINRFFEDGRVTGDASQSTLLNHEFQLSTSNKATADEIQPHRLPAVVY